MSDEREKQAKASRADTDASLTAEREAADALGDDARLIARRTRDDLLERDRLLADEGLWRSRSRADHLLNLERKAAPAPDVKTVRRRKAADDEKAADREMSDRVLDGERDRADGQTEIDRESIDIGQAEHRSLRRATDRNLDAERGHADGAEDVIRDASTLIESMTEERESGRHVLAMVSHDLTSPLSVITLNAGMIVDGAKDPGTREKADAIVRSAARMERLVTDLLDIVHIEAGTFRVDKSEHDVIRLLREISRMYRPLFETRGLTFTVDEPAALPAGYFDHDRVVQVISNLLGNALKFTPEGGSASLSARPRDGSIEFEVRNDGPAIPPDALPHMFERFWQVDDSSRRGLGLGLYISRQIVEQHGGRIWVESREGEGTAFRFTVPLMANAPEDPPAP